MIVLSKFVFLCFTPNLKVKNFYTFCARG